MTEVELVEMERRVEAATAGPWGYTYDGSSDWSVGPAADPQSGQVACCHRHRAVGNPDAEFIAAARTDVPALVAEVRRLRGLIVHAEQGGVAPGLAQCPWCAARSVPWSTHHVDCPAFPLER